MQNIIVISNNLKMLSEMFWQIKYYIALRTLITANFQTFENVKLFGV